MARVSYQTHRSYNIAEGKVSLCCSVDDIMTEMLIDYYTVEDRVATFDDDLQGRDMPYEVVVMFTIRAIRAMRGSTRSEEWGVGWDNLATSMLWCALRNPQTGSKNSEALKMGMVAYGRSILLWCVEPDPDDGSAWLSVGIGPDLADVWGEEGQRPAEEGGPVDYHLVTSLPGKPQSPVKPGRRRSQKQAPRGGSQTVH